MRLRISRSLLQSTFEHFRRCGQGRRECQALWVSPWRAPSTISDVVHPNHDANAIGFLLDDEWINEFWRWLAETEMGIRVQIHTHPGAAYHSTIDDAYPIISSPGFLSLVIPNFATGPIGFESTFLAEIQQDGRWLPVPVGARLELV